MTGNPTVCRPTVVETVCQWLADSLGCTEIFTVPGEAFLPLLADADRHGLACVATRHESGAGFMALTTVRVTGRPSAVAVNRSPGACNVAIAVDAAAAARMPLVVVVGDIDRDADPRAAFQPSDHHAMFGFRAEVVTVTSGAIGEQLERARAALTGPEVRPVVLVVPEDEWTCEVSQPGPSRPGPAATGRTDPITVADHVRAALASAERPVIVLGDQVRRSRSDVRAHELARGLAATGTVAVLAGNKQQDLLDDGTPGFAGHLHLGSPPELRRRLDCADVVVLLGQLPDEVCTSGWDRPQVIVVHPEPPFTKDEWWCADAGAVLAELVATGPVDGGEAGWTQGWHREAMSYAAATVTPYDDGVDMAVVVAALDSELVGPATVTLDAGNFSSWVHRYLRVGPDRWVLALENGAMGFGVPAAVAALRAHPERTAVAVVGDGGLLMTGNELATARAAGRCPVVVVADNCSYGTIHRHGVRRFPDRDCSTALLTPDLVAWAAAFGMPAQRVDRNDEVRDAMRRALAAGPEGFLLHVRSSLAAGHANTVAACGPESIEETV